MPESLKIRKCKCNKSSDLTDINDLPLPDLTYLKEMAGNDEGFVKEIITYFLENGPDLLNTMKERALDGDYEKLRWTAHKLLPQLYFVGILAAVPDVKIIETQSRRMTDLSVNIERAIKIINCGIEDLKKMI